MRRAHVWKVGISVDPSVNESPTAKILHVPRADRGPNAESVLDTRTFADPLLES
mgnify:CR=1 FL=1